MVQGHSGLGPETAMYHVTRILLNAREDIKYSPRAIILLIGMQIVDMKLLDEHLAKVCAYVHCLVIAWNVDFLIWKYWRSLTLRGQAREELVSKTSQFK